MFLNSLRYSLPKQLRSITTTVPFVDRLNKLNKLALNGGGDKRIEAQHKKNKLTARERVGLLFDENTFVEYDRFMVHRCTNFGMDKEHIYTDAVITGHGKIKG